MTDFSPELLTTSLFRRIQQKFKLGLREYLAARDALQGGFGVNLEQLRQTLQLLWCHSLEEQNQFEIDWEIIAASFRKIEPSTQKEQKSDLDFESVSEFEVQPPKIDLPPPDPSFQSQESSEFQPLPFRPTFTPADVGDVPDLNQYFPLSRRSMSYHWRYLRRPIADGPMNVLDLDATINQAANQGFFLAPLYRRREVNHAHLLLLIDQEGSMTPCHHFTRDLVETVEMDNTLEKVEIFYFHNIPSTHLYQDAHLTSPFPFEAVLSGCDSDTSVLIVSDAGAARGYWRMERIRSTTEFLVRLKRKTNLIAWLNPVPQTRWKGTSAELIAYLVYMQQMDKEGLSHAIDLVRGQQLSHLHNGS